MTRGGLWASPRIRPAVDVSMVSSKEGIRPCAYHVERDDILEGDIARLVSSHKTFVDVFW